MPATPSWKTWPCRPPQTCWTTTPSSRAFLSAAAKFDAVQKAMTHLLVPVTLLALLAALAVGLPSADLTALIAPENQHPEAFLNAFPLIFVGWTYHRVMHRVVHDLERDSGKITKAIVVGLTTALLAYLSCVERGHAGQRAG